MAVENMIRNTFLTVLDAALARVSDIMQISY